jgi:hypothetical protein
MLWMCILGNAFRSLENKARSSMSLCLFLAGKLFYKIVLCLRKGFVFLKLSELMIGNIGVFLKFNKILKK